VEAKFLREDLPYFTELLGEVVSSTQYAAHEYNEEVAALLRMEKITLLANASQVAIDSAHGVAFHRGLGNPPSPTKYLNADSIAEFSEKAYSKSNIAVVANGASQADLAKWVGEFFTDIHTGESLSGAGVTRYYGGEDRIEHGSGKSLVLAFQGSSFFTGGSYKPEISVLAALLGGRPNIKWSTGYSLLSKIGSSFPGARAIATNHGYSDAGLLTIQFNGRPSVIRSAALQVVKALRTISEGSISQEDFAKAVANAKYNALEEGQDVEAGVVSTGTSLVHGGSALQIDEIGKAIGSVNIEKLKSAAKAMLEGKATVSAVGDLHVLPYAEELGLSV